MTYARFAHLEQAFREFLVDPKPHARDLETLLSDPFHVIGEAAYGRPAA